MSACRSRAGCSTCGSSSARKARSRTCTSKRPTKAPIALCEVQAYASARLETAAPVKPVTPEPVVAPPNGGAPAPELAYAGVEVGSGDDRKGWGIIEID